MNISVSSAVLESPRVLQVRGLFDLPETKTSTTTWEVDLPIHDRPWHLGLIAGPSGCGKTTIANHFWPERLRETEWPVDRSILDGFPTSLSIHDVTGILSAAGFSSPPAWLRPYQALSTGQQFRVRMARLIAERQAGCASAGAVPIVVDEFTAAVDRDAARISSAAVARAVRKLGLQLVAVTCHEDVEAWLTPDWVYRPAERSFAWRCLQRPAIELEVFRCRASAWPLFAPHHYLSGALARSAFCFLAVWQSRPVAFSAWLPFVGAGPKARREHRTVTLPDFQGVGIGSALSSLIASMWKALGFKATSATSHPAMIRGRCASSSWRMHRAPSFARRGDRFRPACHATTRLTAGFAYVGPAMKLEEAKALLGC